MLLLMQLQFRFECDLHFIIARLTCCLLQNRTKQIKIHYLPKVKLVQYSFYAYLVDNQDYVRITVLVSI